MLNITTRPLFPMFSDIWTLKTIPKLRDTDQMGPKRHREAEKANMEHIGCPSGSQGCDLQSANHDLQAANQAANHDLQMHDSPLEIAL